MRFTNYFLILTMAILGFSYSSVSAQNYANNSAVSQQAIERNVFKELKKLPYYGVFDFIQYKVDGGTVTLYGKVADARNKDDAKRFVRDIPGVTKVVNNIEALPPSPFDDSIRARTLRTFADRGLYMYLWETNPSVRIIVDGGHVTLEGYVANRGDYNLMNILANSVPSVFSVENHLIIENEQNR